MIGRALLIALCLAIVMARQVALDVRFTPLENIDVNQQVFTAEFFVARYYSVPSLTLNKVLANGATLTVAKDVVSGLPTLDNLQFPEAKSMTTMSKERYFYYTAKPSSLSDYTGLSTVAGPWVKVVQQFRGTFDVRMPYKDFPFDTQYLSLVIENVKTGSEYFVGKYPTFHKELRAIPGWNVHAVTSAVADHFYDIGGGVTMSRASFTFKLGRESKLWVLRVVSTLVFLVIVDFFLFALPRGSADRLLGSIFVLLAMVVALFTVSVSDPKIQYVTRVDELIVFLMVLVTAIAMYHMLIMILHRRAADQAKSLKEEAEPTKLIKLADATWVLDIIFGTCCFAAFVLGSLVVMRT